MGRIEIAVAAGVVGVAAIIASCSSGGGGGGEPGGQDAGGANDATVPDSSSGADAGGGTTDGAVHDAGPKNDAAGGGGDAGSDATTGGGDAASDAAADGPTVVLDVADANVVSIYATRVGLGFLFGYSDGDMGAVEAADGGYTFFASAHSQPDAGLCPGTPGTQGVYPIGTDPTSITADNDCTAVVVGSPGSPDGGLLGAYDRDYLGGGPAMRLPNPDGGAAAIVLVYHAEFHWGPQCGAENAPCFYGTLGMASSLDDGRSFTKLGEIIQPSVSRPDWVANHPDASLPDGTGPFVLGDVNAHPIDPVGADPATTYLYVFYIDQNYPDAGVTCPQGGYQCLAAARASLADVETAAFAQDTTAGPTLFTKYYGGAFGPPGVSGDPNDALPSGAFTPVAGATYEESVIYDRTIGQAVLAYRTPQGGISLVTTTDLVHWPSSPLLTVTEAVDGGLRYPSLIGEGPNASVAGPHPWLFYTAGDLWKFSTFENRVLTVSTAP